jgi:DNA-binding winged helix-turn-helix (wHTH) protein/tetratricopeptide (TPR) repeat protein/TolB-like protein
MVLRFAGFELDRQRAELRGPDGAPIKVRPKTLAVIEELATNAGRVLSKQELMQAIWPNIHVGEDSLFQCIKEARTILGDDQRQLIKLVSRRGYLFTAEVSIDPALATAPTPLTVTAPLTQTSPIPEAVSPKTHSARRPIALILTAFCALAIIAAIIVPRDLFGRRLPTIAIMPIVATDGDSEAAAMATDVTTRLADGLAKIETIRVSAPSTTQQANGTEHSDFVVQGELKKSEGAWDVRARMTRVSTGEIVWTEPVSVMSADTDLPLQQSRLVAGIGHPLAVRLAELMANDAPPIAGGGSPRSKSNVAIEQATASIMKTTRERFLDAQTMLVKAVADDPENIALAVSLAALQLRGIQMVWYSPADRATAQTNAKSVLERALRLEPGSIPVLEAYCRFLNATNEFVESLVACARALNVDPWNGMALYHIGLAQLQLGRFDDALATFQQADRFDTPRVSRWTWMIGAGWVSLLMDRNEDAVKWLQRSIAVTAASGRTHMLLAVAYQRLGRLDEARATMAEAMALRPGSTLANVEVPRLNASEAYLAGSRRILQQLAELGLPDR